MVRVGVGMEWQVETIIISDAGELPRRKHTTNFNVLYQYNVTQLPRWNVNSYAISLFI
jgi:hypothetical protein